MRILRISGAVAAVAVALALLSGCAAATEGATDEPTMAPPDVGVQLFQRPWNSIATECEDTIGPAGFAWVLTSPPQEHITGDAWWTSYQPVSYELNSKLGTKNEFADMVARCGAAGVDVIADAVINHMAGIDEGTGFAGTEFTHEEYPGLYDEDDFHDCRLTDTNDIEDYTSRAQVQTCELVNLADLDTGSPSVQRQIADYLLSMLDVGVVGFRIDAAKHMAAEDVQAIVDLLPEDTRILSEVIRGSSDEPIQPEEYLDAGEVFEFQYARDLGPGLRGGFLTDPELGAERPFHVPSDSAITFIDNHDTERGDAALTYRDGALYVIANALMLADDYGTPVVYSGYAFSDREAGASQDASGVVAGWSCADATGPREDYADGDGVCTEAWTAIAGMLEFRGVAGDAVRLPSVGEGGVYGFERDSRALLLTNATAIEREAAVETGLPDGTYCDVISGGRGPVTDGCHGEKLTVTVNDGAIVTTIPAESAVAIHLGSRLPE